MWKTERIARNWFIRKLAEMLIRNVTLQYSNLTAIC